MSVITDLKSFEGSKTGKVEGQTTIESRKGGIEVIAFRWGVEAPRDAHTGLSNGMRSYKVAEWKAIQGKELPQIIQIIDQNETIKELHFDFYMTRKAGQAGGGTGSMIQSLQYKFENVHLAGIDVVQLDVLNPELREFETHYTCRFVYEGFSCSFNNNASTSMSASWQKQQ